MVKDSSSDVTRQEVVGPENSTGNLCKHIEDVSLKEISLAFPTKDLSNVVIHHGELSLIIVNFRIPNFIYICTNAHPCRWFRKLIQSSQYFFCYLTSRYSTSRTPHPHQFRQQCKGKPLRNYQGHSTTPSSHPQSWIVWATISSWTASDSTMDFPAVWKQARYNYTNIYATRWTTCR